MKPGAAQIAVGRVRLLWVGSSRSEQSSADPYPSRGVCQYSTTHLGLGSSVGWFGAFRVAGFRHNRWPTCVGISGRIGSEYALCPVSNFKWVKNG